MILLFSILIALAIGTFVFALVMGREGAVRQFVSRRLRGGGDGNAAPKTEVRIERDDRYSAIPWFDRFLKSLDVGAHLELVLYQAGMTLRPGVLVALMGSFAVAGYIAGLALSHRLFPAIALLVLLAPVPYLYVRFRKAQRMRAFAKEFPDALDLLVSGLRAGLSFNAAMQIVADESPEPVRSEFAITVEEQQLGLDMRDALINLTRRVDVLDLRFFVTAVLLQKETGGNLAEVLTSSAALIRDRFRVLGDIATFTAQGKMTAAILVALPMGVGLFTFMAAPDYFIPMITTEAGRKALWVAGIMQLLGVLVIRRIIQIKV
jgi:tight adherence protein B